MFLTTDLFTGRQACAIAQLDPGKQQEVERVQIVVVVAQISKINPGFISDTWTDFPNCHITLHSNGSFWLDERIAGYTLHCSESQAGCL